MLPLMMSQKRYIREIYSDEINECLNMDQRTIQILFALLRSAICATKLTEREGDYYSPDLLQNLLKYLPSRM